MGSALGFSPSSALQQSCPHFYVHFDLDLYLGCFWHKLVGGT